MNLGQYHTFKIDAGQKLSIMKTYWDKLHFKILNDSMQNTEQSDVKALIMDEGYFQIILELLISVSKGTTLLESSKKLRSTSLKKEMMEMTTIPKNSLSSMNSVFNIFYKLTLKKQNV
jgi:stalled ribosome rescue protein Dom34